MADGDRIGVPFSQGGDGADPNADPNAQQIVSRAELYDVRDKVRGDIGSLQQQLRALNDTLTPFVQAVQSGAYQPPVTPVPQDTPVVDESAWVTTGQTRKMLTEALDAQKKELLSYSAVAYQAAENAQQQLLLTQREMAWDKLVRVAPDLAHARRIVHSIASDLNQNEDFRRLTPYQQEQEIIKHSRQELSVLTRAAPGDGSAAPGAPALPVATIPGGGAAPAVTVPAQIDTGLPNPEGEVQYTPEADIDDEVQDRLQARAKLFSGVIPTAT